MTVVSLDMAYRSFLEVLAGSHPPRYAASLKPSSPRFTHSSPNCIDRSNTRSVLFGQFIIRTGWLGARAIQDAGERLYVRPGLALGEIFRRRRGGNLFGNPSSARAVASSTTGSI